MEVIDKFNAIKSRDLAFSFEILVKNRLKFNNHPMFYRFLLLLSGDLELNPGPGEINVSDQIWNPFKKRGLHFLHLNVNSLLPKIDELRYIVKKSNAAIIGITESKLDDSIMDCEIEISRYDLLRYDRNRNGGGVRVPCYID